MTAQPKSQEWVRTTDAVLVLEDGTVFAGHGVGARGMAVGEVCFNTAMTGYQEILTDPSYSSQIVCFTFPHIGITGINDADSEDESARRGGPPSAAYGVIMRAAPGAAANWRAQGDLEPWLAARGIIGITGIDTRALTAHIRVHGMAKAAMAHQHDGAFDLAALQRAAQDWTGISQADLAAQVSTQDSYAGEEAGWRFRQGYASAPIEGPLVVVIDYGVKRAILGRLGAAGLRTRVLPASASAQEVLACAPDGVVLSNGPGDPAATARHAAPLIRALIAAGVPLFGICLGHQLLALALGGKTCKMAQGHHGANHPVKDLRTGKVGIVSMNHGFTVDADSLPPGVSATHVSLFDGSNCGLRLDGKPVFSVQYHPEASPGPQDSFYLFEDFAALVRARQTASAQA